MIFHCLKYKHPAPARAGHSRAKLCGRIISLLHNTPKLDKSKTIDKSKTLDLDAFALNLDALELELDANLYDDLSTYFELLSEAARMQAKIKDQVSRRKM